MVAPFGGFGVVVAARRVGERVLRIVVGTLPAVIFIVVVQLNFAIAPRFWILHKI